MKTLLKQIDEVRNPEYRSLSQSEIERKLMEVMEGETFPETILHKDPEFVLKISQLYIEFHLNRVELKEAFEFSKDAREELEFHAAA